MFSAVSALRSIKKSLADPYRNLLSWNRGDPCTSSWTGVVCYNTTHDDGYLHTSELYDLCILDIMFSQNTVSKICLHFMFSLTDNVLSFMF